MVQLVKIGDSQGIRIPKPLIKQAHLEGKELKLQIVNDGLLITSKKKAREGWKQAVEKTIAAQGHEMLEEEWLDLPLDSDKDVEW